MWNKRTKVCKTVIAIGFLFTYWIFNYQNTNNETSVVQPPVSDKNVILLDTCMLKKLDPWDPEIDKMLNVSYNPLENCTPTFDMATKLENGKLYLLDQRENVQCWWQCLLPKNDTMLTPGGWNKLINGSVPECDIVETACILNDNNASLELTPNDAAFKANTYYEYLHAQIYRKDTPKPEEPPQLDRPDVHIIVIDSVSYSQSVRALPKTRYYLREHFDAISFPYLNKIGINSSPNGWAFLMGKTIYDIRKSPLSVGYPSDCQNKHCCHILEEGNFIGTKFHEASYTTMMNEDYFKAIFSEPPPCFGFNHTPVDHYMHPYYLRVDDDKYATPLLKNNIHKGSCRESFMSQMEYLHDFLEKYPDKPKFTITWTTQLAHDDNNDLFHADDYYYNFFKNHHKKFDNSYLFVMGDHGIRYGLPRLTGAGEREDNNPFLLMALPASLRGNESLVSTIQHNARQLVSHYDLYATFIDIVAPFRPNTSSDAPLYGTSLMKPLPQPRTCDRLRIPFEYCICDHPRTKLPDDTAPAREAAALIVKNLNNLISGSTLKSICEPLTLSSTPVAVERFNVEGSLSFYKVTLKVEPGKGHFYGYISQNHTTAGLSLLSNRISRLDSYAATAYCAKTSEYARYCYCSELKSTTTQPQATTVP